MPWRLMQVCDPPITTARLKTYRGAELWQEEQLNLTENYTPSTTRMGSRWALCMTQPLLLFAITPAEKIPGLAGAVD
jgi:hypothetical protein